jgi:DNA invertase Pin-like site-specific DNA recombinase
LSKPSDILSTHLRLKPDDYLLVEDSDRLTREDWLTGMNLVADIVGRGAKLVTLDNNNIIDAERFRPDPGCFLPAIMRAHIGHDEDNKKSGRARESWEARLAGLAMGTPANLHLPAWLYWDYEAKQPKLDDHNARIVRKMFALALEGLGCLTIARKLHEAGERLMITGKRKNGTPRSRKSKPGEAYTFTLSQPYVWRTLQNKLCIGYGVYAEPPKPGVYPAVVTEEIFFAVQKLLKHNKYQTVARASTTSNLFTGIAYCSRCCGNLCRFSQRRNGKRYEYLVCGDRMHKHGKCGMAGIRYDQFEESFLHLLAQTGVVKQTLGDEQLIVPSRLDTLSGELAEAENIGE